MKTLQECKDDVAKKHGHDNWKKFINYCYEEARIEIISDYGDMAAELYAQSLKEENERLKSEIESANKSILGYAEMLGTSVIRERELESDLKKAKRFKSPEDWLKNRFKKQYSAELPDLLLETVTAWEKYKNISLIDKPIKTPKEVSDKYTESWAQDHIWQYEKCSRAKILAWGYKEGYEECRKDFEYAQIQSTVKPEQTEEPNPPQK